MRKSLPSLDSRFRGKDGEDTLSNEQRISLRAAIFGGLRRRGHAYWPDLSRFHYTPRTRTISSARRCISAGRGLMPGAISSGQGKMCRGTA